MSAPNIVVVYADDLGYGDLGCYGGEAGVSPHLDALAASGVRATSWYSNAPVCSPSRAALLTGRHPVNTGVTQILGGARRTPGLPPDRTTVASMLRDQGYATGLFGKWHLGVAPEYRPRAHGFDRFFGILAGCVDYYSHIFYWGQAAGTDPVHDLWDDDEEVWRNGEYLTSLITERAVEFIEQQDRPFFCYVPYNAPHYPMHAPPEYLERFAHLSPDRQTMCAMIAAMDDGVGEILAALDRTGQRDNTIVVFSSDNGPSTETRNWLDGTEDRYYGGTAGGFRGHKGSLFEGGIREPFLISYPGRLPAGAVRDEPAQMSDVVPTVLALAGLPPAPATDGVDVSGMLRGETEADRQLFWSHADQLAVRDGDWKLVLNPWLDGTEDRYYGGTAGGFRGHKGSLFEGGIREPFLISYPGRLPAGAVRDEPAQMSDVVPTVLALAGLPPAPATDGVDVSGMLRGETLADRQLFWSHADQLAVRDGDWKLVLNPWLDFDRKLDARVHLANLAADPGEQVDLSAAEPAIAERLTARVREWYGALTAG